MCAKQTFILGGESEKKDLEELGGYCLYNKYHHLNEFLTNELGLAAGRNQFYRNWGSLTQLGCFGPALCIRACSELGGLHREFIAFRRSWHILLILSFRGASGFAESWWWPLNEP